MKTVGRAGGGPPETISLETKYLHLRHPVPLGHRMDGWRVCWLGGWDKQRVFFVVMVVRVKPLPVESGLRDGPGRERRAKALRCGLRCRSSRGPKPDNRGGSPTC